MQQRTQITMKHIGEDVRRVTVLILILAVCVTACIAFGLNQQAEEPTGLRPVHGQSVGDARERVKDSSASNVLDGHKPVRKHRLAEKAKRIVQTMSQNQAHNNVADEATQVTKQATTPANEGAAKQQPPSNSSSMSEQTEVVAGSTPPMNQQNTNAGATGQRLEESRNSDNERSSAGAQQNDSLLDFLLGAMPSGKSQEARLQKRALRLHGKIQPDAAIKRAATRNYFLEEEGVFEVADVDWSVCRLLDAELNHVYSGVGDCDKEEIFVFDKRERQVTSLAKYVPQTKLGRWWLTCQTAKTPTDFARFVSGQAGTLFVKLNPPWSRLDLFDFEFRNLAASTIEAALKKSDLGELVQGEGESSLWFRTSDLELAALIVERTLETCGLLQGSSIMDAPENESMMPKVFYPRHRRRVVTEWGS